MRAVTQHPATTFTLIVSVLGLGLLTPSAGAAVVFGQLDDFQDGTTMGWDEAAPSPNPPTNVATGGPGGAGDRFLSNVASGEGTGGSRQIMFNRAQWIGNYSTAGVTRIQGQVANLGSTDMTIRVAVEGGGRWFASNNAAAVPLRAGAGWQSVSFDLNSTTLTFIEGFPGSLAATLANVTELRILSSATPNFRGDPIASTLGVDNLRALRLPGDANFSGAVESTDFVALASNFGKTGQTWRTGDFNFDARVDSADFVLLAANFGTSIPASAAASVTDADRAALEAFGASIGASPVPEPSCLCLLALTPLLARRARRAASCPSSRPGH